MKRTSGMGRKATRTLLLGASSIAIGLAANPAFAQDVDEDEAQESENVIIVSGIRAALDSAQDQKREADTIVDVVTASDIGALPDRSVSEVLQRVPGVSVLRFAGPNDPDHFAVEGSGVVIRGLPFVRSELNGRDAFAATSSGVLGFEDVSPELLGSVVVFKNSSADLIEGGAAGTIDLRTRLPFDGVGETFSISGELNYGDLAEELSPSFSALYSNEFDVGSGRIGILGNIAMSQLLSRGDGTGIVDYVADSNGNYIPSGGSIRTQDFDRQRFTVAGALQYESGDRRWLATAQFLRSDSRLQWGERVIETTADSAGGRDGYDQSDFVFDEDGVFQSGTIADNSQWRGQNATAALLASEGGLQARNTRERLEEDVTTDYGFNLKWSPTDRLRFNFDAQYIDSTADVVDLSVFGAFFSPVFIDSGRDGVAEVSFVVPDGESADYFADPSNYYLRAAMDHVTQNEADSLAFRADMEYDFSEDGFLRRLRVGGRYSQQDSTLRQSDFNWGNISEVWTGANIQNDPNGGGSILLLGGNPNAALDRLVDPIFRGVPYENYQRGISTGTGNGGVPTYVGPLTDDFMGFQNTFNNIIDVLYGAGNNGPSGWRPLTSRGGVIAGTPFLPSEIGEISRDTWAAYVRLDYGADMGDAELTGNVGVRYVRTDRSVDSSLTVNPFDQYLSPAQLALCDPATQPVDPNFTTPQFCSLDIASLQAAIGPGFFVNRTIESDYDYFLPSFNVKLELPGGHVIRGAASRTLTRPGVDQLNERVVLNTAPAGAIDTGGGNTVPGFSGFVGNATGNARLDPQLAWNFDVSYEWYFDNAGSITIAGFHKSIDNFIAFAPVAVDLSGDGVNADFLGNPLLNPLLRNTEINSDENGEVTGFEIAYQQFYDFLPGALGGLGLQASYTFIDAEGVANQLDPNIPADDPPTARFDIDSGIFPRISRHNVNLIGLYEYGPVQARLAYNWRSTFQLTPRDVIFPFNSIYQPSTGQLDASIFFDITDQIKVGVQAVNLLDDITETTQTIDASGLRAPRNYFRNDRRFTFIVRATL